MCGIVGFITRPEKGPDLAAAMHRPLLAMAPRGPDDEGVWIDPMAGVALGARRLAVTDLSNDAQQPMVSANGRWHVVFNGHIAGHQALRKRFLAAQPMPSHGDTATLVALISELGFAEVLPLLEGQFAIAAWDAYTETLHLARDRFGVRPLVYGSTTQGFGFASTVRAWSLLPGVDLRLDPRAIDIFSSFGWVPAPMTIYGQARSVLPGERLEVRGNGQVEQEMWWSESAAVELAKDQSIGADAIEAIIDASIREQLEAERGVGLFLSGGIDSSIIASSPAVREAALPAFVATFPDAECFDESNHAQGVADACGLPLTKIDMTDDRIQEAASRLGAAYDEPFADASALPTLALTKEVAQYCTVALSGDGGDELFGGYRRHSVLTLRAALPSPLRFLGGFLGGRLGEALRSPTDHEAWATLVRMHPGLDGMDDPIGDVGGLAGALRRDTRLALPGDLLVKMDRAAMDSALEVRTPFLTEAVHAAAWSLRNGQRKPPTTGAGKPMLRQLLKTRVPGIAFDRRKQGFAAPLGDWLRGPLRQWVQSLPLEPIAHLGDPNEHLQSVWSGDDQKLPQLWLCITFAAWSAHNRSMS
jgi:asparagine synthase (glutamine-hydrolysing)